MITFTDEALGVMRQALAGDVVELRSAQHTIEGYEAGPIPPTPVPLWLGSSGPRMLALTGRSSDGWVSPLNTYAPPASIPAKQRLIDEAARSAGRVPADVHRIYNVVGAIDARTAPSAFSRRCRRVGGRSGRLVAGPRLRHVHLLADDIASRPAQTIRRRGGAADSEAHPGGSNRQRRTIMNDKPISSGHRTREEMHA